MVDVGGRKTFGGSFGPLFATCGIESPELRDASSANMELRGTRRWSQGIRLRNSHRSEFGNVQAIRNTLEDDVLSEFYD